MPPTVEQIANAVHYGGYTLYPYQSSAVKNRREGFAFGRVRPKDFSESPYGDEPCLKQTECLLELRNDSPALDITVRFLQPMWRDVGYVSTEFPFRALAELEVDGRTYQTRLEAVERRIPVSLKNLDKSQRATLKFAFPAVRFLEPIGGKPSTDGSTILRRQEAIEGAVETEIERLATDLVKVSVRILNLTPTTGAQCRDKDAVMMRTFASTHAILQSFGAHFSSMMDPPAKFAPFAALCKNIGTWPVLIGHDVMLSSPVILCDFPPIVPESISDFAGDSGEDEMLALRVHATEGEVPALHHVDDITDLWSNDQSAPEIETHSDLFNACTPLRNVLTQGRDLRAGDCVRIRPTEQTAIMDSKLAGKTATIESIEEDGEGRVLLGLVFAPQADKSNAWPSQAGERFFFGLDEIEVLEDLPAT